MCRSVCVCVIVYVFAWCLYLQRNLVLMTVGYCPACNSDRQECVWMCSASACVSLSLSLVYVLLYVCVGVFSSWSVSS